jgi:Fe2+ or Zn2+ uptake regulation protein
MKPVVVSPGAKRGLRYCGKICVPDLFELLDARPTVAELLARYRNSHAGIPLPTLHNELAQLLRLGIVQSCRQ